MENRMEAYLRLKSLVESIADDVAKAQGGNKAAGTRVRKVMQDIKNAAQEVRVKILESRDGEGDDAQTGPGAGPGNAQPAQ